MQQSFPASMTIGLVPMGAKPLHQAHFAMIEHAALENDHVIVYVSTVDRRRKGEITITGIAMVQIWKQYLEGITPENVTVEYSPSPVRDVYEQIGKENERFMAGDHDVATYTIYAGGEDIDKSYPEESMEKYFSAMWNAGMIDKRINPAAAEYSREAGFTGTDMRQHISDHDMKQFISKLPDPLSEQQRNEIWNILISQL